jgi:hypothetical protein
MCLYCNNQEYWPTVPLRSSRMCLNEYVPRPHCPTDDVYGPTHGNGWPYIALGAVVTLVGSLKTNPDRQALSKAYRVKG